ncbi:hypothetical protein AGMMS50262_22300 [Bacteroidia bacterium]|nr:hypothetical protein AGMMS50262_22300 [Bacteroidia bacterium]
MRIQKFGRTFVIKSNKKIIYDMKKSLFCIILFLATLPVIHSQDIQSYEPTVVPPMPSAYQMTTYGNIPVVNCSGTFSHTIPIYTIQYLDITLPVSLNYSSNGVRVDQLASIVGTDWNLNTGGVISRVINDEADETHTRWYPNDLDIHNTTRKTDIINLSTGVEKPKQIDPSRPI